MGKPSEKNHNGEPERAMPERHPNNPEAVVHERSGELCEIIRGIDNLPPEEKQIVVRSVMKEKSETFRGPLPHPELMEKYEHVLPGAAERIFAMAEKEQAHRIDFDNRQLDGIVGQLKRGQWMGYTLSIFFGIVAVVAACLGHPVLAGIIAGGVIVALAIVFALNKEPKNMNPDERADI